MPAAIAVGPSPGWRVAKYRAETNARTACAVQCLLHYRFASLAQEGRSELPVFLSEISGSEFCEFRGQQSLGGGSS
jgi:hypothetical protein